MGDRRCAPDRSWDHVPGVGGSGPDLLGSGFGRSDADIWHCGYHDLLQFQKYGVRSGLVPGRRHPDSAPGGIHPV